MDEIVHKTDKYIERHLKDKFILKKIQKDEFIICDDISYEIYKLINGKNSIEKIFKILSQDYDVNPDVLKNDLLEFINSLKESDVVTLKKKGEPLL